RLEHERATGGDARRNLVRGEVEREVERGNERARTDRHAFRETAITLRTWRDLEIDRLAVDAHGFLGGNLERVDQSRDFAARIADRLAGLDAERHSEFVVAF